MNRKITFASKLFVLKIDCEPNRTCYMADISTISRRSYDTEYLKEKFGINWYKHVVETPTIDSLDSKNDFISEKFRSLISEFNNYNEIHKCIGMKYSNSYDNLEQLTIFQDN